MNIGEINGVQVAVSPEAYEEIKKQKIIEENKILKEQQQELERYKNIVHELETYLQRKYGEYVDMESDDRFVISLVLDTLRELKGE